MIDTGKEYPNRTICIIFVASNNRLFDFNPFHLLVLLAIFFYSFFFQNKNIRFTLDRDTYDTPEIGKKFRASGEINHFGKNLSRIWFCLSITIWNRRVKNVSICKGEIRNWNIFKENHLSVNRDLNKFTFKSVDQVRLLVNLTYIYRERETCTYIFDAKNYKGRWKDYIYIFHELFIRDRHAKRKNRKLLGGSWKKNYI